MAFVSIRSSAFGRFITKVFIGSEMILEQQDSSEFLSWNGVIAICTALVFLGTFLDWVLRVKQKVKILAWLREWENRISKTPFKEIQKFVAHSFLYLIDGLVAIEGCFRWLAFGLVFSFLIGKYVLGHSSPALNKFSFFLTPSCIFLAFIVIRIVAGLLSALGTERLAFSMTVIGDLWARMRFGLYSICDKLLHLLDNTKFVWQTIGISFISTLVSYFALNLGVDLGSYEHASYWFKEVGYDIEPDHTLILTMVNFVFDYLTIVTAVKLLKWAIKRENWFSLIAFLDIAVSAFLTIALLSSLYLIDPTKNFLLLDSIAQAWRWFLQVITFNFPKNSLEWPLTPLLFTTFIPVTIYMTAFIIVGFILKPLAKAAAYSCGLFGEKEDTPFKELAVILSLLTAAIKALSEWPWFLEQSSEFFK